MRDRNEVERRFAEFYELYVDDFRQDLPIYLELAGKHSGPVLEVGCKTGRVAEQLARAGHEVMAIDTGRPMLEHAIERLRPFLDRVRVADFDLRAQPLPERFPVALVTLFAYNGLIDVEEQRLFLRHLRQSMSRDGAVALDLFCPLALVRPEQAGEWRDLERVVGGSRLQVRDLREMLTPLLERRAQRFRIDDGPELEIVTHRRYLTPRHASLLLQEAGFDNIRWVRDYDLSTAEPVPEDAIPSGPFMMLGEP